MHFSNKLSTLILKIIHNIELLRYTLSNVRKNKQSIGFVPTMGCLHEGHVSLLQKSINDNNVTLCSIYVNPTQFNDKIDFKKYPRDINSDIKVLKKINCDILFLPIDDEIYPKNDTKEDYSFMHAIDILEGEKRPGHFFGVLTVVHRLFNLVQPNRAYFGEKDYQQLWLIQKFVNELKMPITVLGCPTIRTALGLALSSRNQRLTEQDKKTSLILFQSINNLQNEIKLNLKHNNTLSNSDLICIKERIRNKISHNINIKLDYFEVIDVENFSFVKEINKYKKYRILIAAYISKIRLIDNILIDW